MSSTNSRSVTWLALAGTGTVLVALGFACTDSGAGPASGDDSGVTQDVATDAGVPEDSPADAPCQPGTATGFVPKAVTAMQQKACSDAQITAFIGECYSSAATQQTCMTWLASPANFICRVNCLITEYAGTPVTPGITPPPAPVSPWGPIVAVVNRGETDWLDIGACVAIADPSQGACSTAYTNAFECEYYSCAADPACSVPTDPAESDTAAHVQALRDCFAAADKGPCATYANAIGGACATADAGPGAFCFGAASDNTALTKMVTQQCGGGDGGGRYGQ
jgi:hypothetical protein